MNKILEIKNVGKTYTDDIALKSLENINLSLKNNEFVTIFGPNGSGKTTLLNIISGLDSNYQGEIHFDQKIVTNTREFKVNYVFQNYNESLFPWLNVYENIIFPLTRKSFVLNQNKVLRLDKILDVTKLSEFKDSYVYSLSGGMRQLVCIARAFINDSDILIMDEPCSALDYATTKKIDLEILKLWGACKRTTIVVSHDIDEAIYLADRVIILSPRPGRIKKIIDVNIPRPRTKETFESKEFFETRSQVLKEFTYE